VGDEEVAESIDGEVLNVYVSREGGWWHPDHGDVEIPDGWALLPAGDAYLTRTVTKAGPHWIAWRPGDRRRRQRLGLWAPEENIELAERQAARTAAGRARARERAAVQRDRTEGAYRDELVAAIVTWLDFAEENGELAARIAQAAADHAAVVGSRRVGRTSTLSLEEKAALAARAHIRHHHTDYEDQLIEHEAATGLANLDTETYRALRRIAHKVVDAFIDEHRDRSSDA
jgi:hypothetical protein